ncbi:urate hydroxylase PuuD [Sphingosinicella sp. CPCC 101087]|uniref:urate hydroxylase PuuD n=1 Tax=Sphingosinicella sp. CPCC 101087 TaxID=2497754 RepID=UPI00101E008D|nr:urate hydroxylase PuuD [Sphingosinicella sp. CPCC 101087]
MAKILGNFHLALLIGLALLVIAMVGLHSDVMDGFYWAGFLRFLHVFAGVLWIGLLYYFNFVQIPTMPKVPAELKPGVSRYIAPAALFWFRWAALATLILGLLVAEIQEGGYSARALTLAEGYRTIGVGMWLGIVMAANVWFVIWPNQKRALGLVEADDASKARSATTAMMASRTNLILSLPMLYCMVGQIHMGA